MLALLALLGLRRRGSAARDFLLFVVFLAFVTFAGFLAFVDFPSLTPTQNLRVWELCQEFKRLESP